MKTIILKFKDETLANLFQKTCVENKVPVILGKNSENGEFTLACDVTNTPDQSGQEVNQDQLNAALSSLWQSVAYALQDMRQQMGDMQKNMYDYTNSHSKGHLPPILGAEKMQNALDTLGIEGDYDVQKPVVWVRAREGAGRKSIFTVN